MMEDSLHRSVQVILTNTTLICAYECTGVKIEGGSVVFIYLNDSHVKTWNKWKTTNIQDMLATITEKSL